MAPTRGTGPPPVVDVESLLRAIPEAVLVVDGDGRIVLANAAVESVFGYRADEVAGQSIEQLVPERFREAHARHRARYRAEPEVRTMGSGLELAGRRKDGTEFPLDISLAPMRLEEDPVFIAVVRDVSGRKLLSERRLEAFFTSAPAGMAVLDDQLRFVQINETLAEVHGLPVAEHLGRTVEEVLPELAVTLAPLLRKILATGEPSLHHDFTGETPAQPGVLRHWVASHFPVQSTPEGPAGVGVVVVDITRQKQAEELARKQAELLDLASNAIAVLDMEGRITYWNRGAERLYGWAGGAARGQHIATLLKTVFPELPERIMARLLEAGHWEGEFEQTRKDGSRVVVFSHWTLQRDDRGEPLAVLEINNDITARKRVEAELRELSGRLLQVQDEERRRIARELHETTAQNLAALQMNLDLIQSTEVKLEERVRQAASESTGLVQDCIREVRTLSHLLYPPLLDEAGLEAALRAYGKGFAGRSGTRVHFELQPDLGRLPKEIELAVFRVAQEALTNVHRHSGSPDARIRLARDSKQVVLEIEDSGHGMPHASPDGVSKPGAFGIGILGMRERMMQLGGRLEIHSGERRGTRVRAAAPLPEPLR